MVDMTISLTDKAVGRLAASASGQYHVKDDELKGFFLLVGKRRRTYMVRGDLRRDGKRVSSVKVSVGDAAQISAREARSIARSYLGKIGQGQHPKAPEAKAEDSPKMEMAQGGVTLRQAWDRYLEVHLIRKNRSRTTIIGYRDHCERLLKSWLDIPLQDLVNDPARVAKMHDKITNENGPYLANGSMRTLRAIYNHARKIHRTLPVDNPANAVDWNVEERRNTAMGLADLPIWFEQLAMLENPIRREYHLLTLLSGCRPSALKAVKITDFDWRRRTLHIARPKGGSKRAFDIPLSREMTRSISRAVRSGRIMHPENADQWLFPADSKSGHLVEQKEDRDDLSKWGNDLRQSYRTFAAVAGVSEVDAQLLMNHAMPGVNSGYITRHKLLEDHLRSQQQAISDIISGSVLKKGTF